MLSDIDLLRGEDDAIRQGSRLVALVFLTTNSVMHRGGEVPSVAVPPRPHIGAQRALQRPDQTFSRVESDERADQSFSTRAERDRPAGASSTVAQRQAGA